MSRNLININSDFLLFEIMLCVSLSNWHPVDTVLFEYIRGKGLATLRRQYISTCATVHGLNPGDKIRKEIALLEIYILMERK